MSYDNELLDSEVIHKHLGPEEKIKQEKVIPFLRNILGFKLMDFEVPVRFGRMTKFADIVIYAIENNRKIPYLVVECKAPDNIKDDDWLQAESYAQRLGSQYFVITDGSKDRWMWYKTGERQGESNQIAHDKIPYKKIQKEGTTLIKFDDINSLARIVQQCHDVIRNEEGKDPAESFDEMSKLLFAKMKDERNVRDRTRSYEFTVNESDTDNSIAERVKDLFEQAKQEFPKIYSEVESRSNQKLITINLKNHTISEIVAMLSPYTLLETKTDSRGLDIKGTTFETFLKGTFRGSLGQFFTPRAITDFMVGITDPKDNEIILDPACGSGGFLIACLKRIFEDLDEQYRLGHIDDLDDHKKKYAANNLFGMDINDRMTWVAKMNMVFHGDGHGNIVSSNSFIKTTRNEHILTKKFNLVLTNPPFGSTINDPQILSNPNLKPISKAKSTEVLFLGLCIDILKPGGKLGMVLPDGVLTNSSLKFVRDFIKEQTIVKAIVSLPTETFMPFGAGVKTSLIFLDKKNPENPYSEQGPIFMAIAQDIGYDSTGRKTEKNDLNKILEEYKKFEEKHYCSV